MKFLVIDDQPEIIQIASEMLERHGHTVDAAHSSGQAERLILERTYDAVFCDIHMQPKSGIDLLESLKSGGAVLPTFVFVTGSVDQELIERANRVSKVDVVLKPFTAESLLNSVTMSKNRQVDRILDVMEVMRQVSGINLGSDKRRLVETRLNRRARELRMKGIEEYYDYFIKNRHLELPELVSHLTTHHTFFFREQEHFEFLKNSVFPIAIKEQRTIRIWSAASSTGEEAYSIATAWFEFLAKEGALKNPRINLEILGTDIDERSVERASKGIYLARRLSGVTQHQIKNMFDIGSGDLAEFVRVKQHLFDRCRFKRHNLQVPLKVSEPFDCIFVRNVLIYFSPSAAISIVRNVLPCLRQDGHLILGHSESIDASAVALKNVGQSVYKKQVTSSVLSAAPTRESHRLVRVFVIDDSLTLRASLKKILDKEHGFEVVGEAASGKGTIDFVKRLAPDVVTLDIHMPEVDGLTYLKSIEGEDHPPVVVISSVSQEEAATALRCFELGAVEYVEKPGANFMKSSDDIRSAVNAAARNRSRRPSRTPISIAKSVAYSSKTPESDLICIGASTGGVEALGVVLKQFPSNSPPTLVVQHIPPVFSRAMAHRLDTLCQVTVKEAQDGDIVTAGCVYIAPGGKQMGLKRFGSGLKIVLTDDEPVNRHRPSVDYLFESVVANAHYRNIGAAILTGMGSDGARGMSALRKIGSYTVAQNEESSVVFGMPRAAIEQGAAIDTVDLGMVASSLFEWFNQTKKHSRDKLLEVEKNRMRLAR